MESHKKLVKKTGTFSQIRLYSNCEVWYNKKRSGAENTTSSNSIICLDLHDQMISRQPLFTRKIIAW